MVVMDMEVTVIMATTAREILSQLLLLKPMLSQDIIIMATVVMDMEVTVIMATTAREMLSQLLLLMPMLSLDIIIMVTLMVMAMDTDTMDIMARGRQMLSPGIIITVTDTLMVDMAITVIMARERLSQDIIIMAMVMVDMAITVMDTTVNKQH